MVTSNAGALQLAAALKPFGAKARLSKEWEVTPATISRWLAGEHLPNVDYRERLQERFGIDWRDWDKPADSGGGQ